MAIMNIATFTTILRRMSGVLRMEEHANMVHEEIYLDDEKIQQKEAVSEKVVKFEKVDFSWGFRVVDSSNLDTTTEAPKKMGPGAAHHQKKQVAVTNEAVLENINFEVTPGHLLVVVG